jgi:hypothetical protein
MAPPPPPPRESGLKVVCNVNIAYGTLKYENSILCPEIVRSRNCIVYKTVCLHVLSVHVCFPCTQESTPPHPLFPPFPMRHLPSPPFPTRDEAFQVFLKLTINVPVVYMVRYKVVLRGDYP